MKHQCMTATHFNPGKVCIKPTWLVQVKLTATFYLQLGLLDYGKYVGVSARVCVCERVCVITKPERFWELRHIKYSLVSFSVRNTICGGSAA